MTPQRYEALANLIKNGRNAFNLSPLADDALEGVIEAYERVLEQVPTGYLLSSFHEATRLKTDSYMPNANDIYHAWNRPQQAQRDASRSGLNTTFHVHAGMRSEEEENQRVADFQASERRRRELSVERNRHFQELEARGELHAKLPPRPDVFDWPMEEMRNGIGAMNDAKFSDSELLTTMALRCETPTYRNDITDADYLAERRNMLKFGRWLLKRFTLEEWSADLAHEQWETWQSETVNKQATETPVEAIA